MSSHLEFRYTWTLGRMVFAFCRLSALLLAGKDFVLQRGAFSNLEWERVSQGL